MRRADSGLAVDEMVRMAVVVVVAVDDDNKVD